MIEVPVRRLRDDAVLPIQAYPGDAGLDLTACEDVTLAPGERATMPTGIAVEIRDLRVVLINTDLSDSFSVERGMRIAQLVIAPVATVRVVEVDELATSQRGGQGFGSSAH